MHVVAARAAACSSLRRMGYSLAEIGRALRLHHTTVRHHVMGPSPKRITKQELQSQVAKLRWKMKTGAIPIPDLSGEWDI